MGNNKKELLNWHVKQQLRRTCELPLVTEQSAFCLGDLLFFWKLYSVREGIIKVSICQYFKGRWSLQLTGCHIACFKRHLRLWSIQMSGQEQLLPHLSRTIKPRILWEYLFCIKTLQFLLRKVEVQVAQLCPTLCDPMHCAICGILQARRLEWVTFPFSGGIFSTQGLSPGLL